MVFSSKFQRLFKTLFMLVAILKTADCETFAECENVPDRTFTGSTTSCNDYIYCNGDESFIGQCDSDSYFNDEEKVCDDKEFVDCHLEDDDDNKTTTITISTIIPITTTISPITSSTISSTSMANTTNANNVTTAVVNTTTVAANISTGISTLSTTTTSTTITFTECPSVDNPFQIVFLASSKSCSEYFVCIRGTPIQMFCSGMLHFNSATGKCDYPENVRCLPDYSKPKEQCHINIVDFYPHISNCNYYYRCQNGFLMLQQCPLFFGWDFEKRSCVAMNKVKCYA